MKSQLLIKKVIKNNNFKELNFSYSPNNELLRKTL